MSTSQENEYLVLAREDLSEWIEERVLIKTNSKTIVKFLWEDIICRHECFEKLIVDEESENKDLVEEMINRYKIKRIVVSVYHSQANEMIEREHTSIVDALSKLSKEDNKEWV